MDSKINAHVKFEDHGGIKCEFNFNGNLKEGIEKMERFFENVKLFTNAINEKDVKIQELISTKKRY